MNRLITGFIAVLLAVPAGAEQDRKPLWEAGIGLGAVSFPDYRGSDQRQTYTLPIPYAVYRGERLKVDREGLRGLLYSGERANVDISLDGAVPVDSDQNGRREGMPDLEPVLEVGPSLKIDLWRSGDQRLRFDAALRAALAVGDAKLGYEGWVFHPRLDYTRFGKTGIGFSAGPLFASRAYHGYYYDVAQAYATAVRPQYQADAGYSGFRVTLTFNRRTANWYTGAFVRYDDVSEATFVDSPLVVESRAIMAGISVARIFARSQQKVPSLAAVGAGIE